MIVYSIYKAFFYLDCKKMFKLVAVVVCLLGASVVGTSEQPISVNLHLY